MALLPILVFWVLDTYFLRAERLFRALFNEVVKGSGTSAGVAPFFMAATDRKMFPPPTSASWPRTFVRGTLLWFYGVLLTATGLVILVICTGSDAADDSGALLERAARLADAVGYAVKVYLV